MFISHTSFRNIFFPIFLLHFFRGRTSSISWRLLGEFPSVEALQASQVYSQLKNFSRAHIPRKSKQATVEVWRCKYSRKNGFKICPVKMKLEFMHGSSSEVFVFDKGGECNHETDRWNRRGFQKFLWTEEQEKLLLQLIPAGATAKLLLRQVINLKL